MAAMTTTNMQPPTTPAIKATIEVLLEAVEAGLED